MDIINRDVFREKVEVIIEALLSHNLTRADAAQCLSSVIVVPAGKMTSSAVVQAEREMLVRERRESGIDLNELREIGVEIPVDSNEDSRAPRLEFELQFATESMPGLTEDMFKRWQVLATKTCCDDTPVVRRESMILDEPKAYKLWKTGQIDPELDSELFVNEFGVLEKKPILPSDR